MSKTETAIKCVDIQLDGCGPRLVVPADELDQWTHVISDSEVGDSYTVTVTEYTEAEIEAMGEFQGF